jgi:hypothetical protein
VVSPYSNQYSVAELSGSTFPFRVAWVALISVAGSVMTLGAVSLNVLSTPAVSPAELSATALK